MSIVPCGICHSFGCNCTLTANWTIPPCTTTTWVPTYGFGRISDDEIERIAQRVAALLAPKKRTRKARK